MTVKWHTSKLREIADVRVSNVDKKSYASERSIKLCNYMDVYANDYVTSAIDFMPATASPSEIERFALHVGDVVITKDSETPDDIGVPAVVVEDIDGLVCGYHLALIRPKGSVEPTFLAKQLASAPTIKYFAANATGSTRFGLAIGAIEKLDIRTPPIGEQVKIAEVLSTVDRAIEQTEAVITKQQRIKTGLMQDLLTRGIDKHGNLRSEQTHEFKDSSLGRIPAGWEVKALSEIGWFTNGINKSKEDFGFGTLFVNIADVYPDHLDVHSLGRLNASDAEATRYGLNIGDILIDRSSVKLEGVGYPTVFEGHNEPVVFCGFIIRFRPRVDINSRFLCLQMRDDPFRIEVFKVATRSANVNVNQESLAELRIKIPTVDEQNRIVSFEAAIDKEYQNLRTQLVKLASLKTALMQDLLTGKKRVNALLEQVAKD